MVLPLFHNQLPVNQPSLTETVAARGLMCSLEVIDSFGFWSLICYKKRMVGEAELGYFY